MKLRNILYTADIETPIGMMRAIANDDALLLLEFIERKNLEKQVAVFEKMGFEIIVGRALPIDSVENELKAYFEGTLKEWETPIVLHGTPFQQLVWQELRKIVIGKTISYAELAKAIGRPLAHRAVASANARNRLAIIVPCHRVIRMNGNLGGYAGKVHRKEFLIEHEQTVLISN